MHLTPLLREFGCAYRLRAFQSGEVSLAQGFGGHCQVLRAPNTSKRCGKTVFVSISGRSVRATGTAVDDGVCTDKPSLAVQTVLQFPEMPITKTDQAFLADGLEFVYTSEGIDMDELNDLFGKVGFPRRNAERLKLALDNTHLVLWVRSTKQSRWAKKGQLLAFARATTDRAMFGTIWDVAVNPSWQRVGIGRAAVERLAAMLLEADIATICLYAEPTVVGLYQRLGFEKDFKGLRGMSFQQKGAIGRKLMMTL